VTQESDIGQGYCRIGANFSISGSLHDLCKIASQLEEALNLRSAFRTARRRAANCNNGHWLCISSIGWDWVALFVVPLLAVVDQSFVPGPMPLASVLLAWMTAYRERKAIDVPA